MNHVNTLALAAVTMLATAPLTATADGNFYLGGSVGSASLSEDFDGFDVDSSSTAFRLIAGWQFNDYFSVEGGYHNFGTFEQRFDAGGTSVNVSLKADGFTLGATGTIPLNEKFAVYCRAGSFFWDGDAEINNVSQATPEDTNFFVGLGVNYSVSGRLFIVADGSRYELENTQSTVVSLGFTVSL